MHRFMRGSRAAAVAAALLLLLTACGGDGEGEGEDLVAAYCEQAAELDEQDGMPSDEQMDALAESAPEEIAEDVTFAAEAIKEKGANAFGDPEVNERIETIEAYEKEHCPQSDDEGDDEGEDEEEPVAQEPAADAQLVEVTAKDLEFQITGDVPTGKVAFVMTNQGEQPHHMSIVRFKEGVTQEQVRKTIADGEDVQQHFEEEIGQSTDAAPGETAVVNAELRPGLHGMACFVTGEEGVPHFFEGMFHLFEVA